MDLPPLPAEWELQLVLDQLLKDHFGPRPQQFSRPLSLQIDTGIRDDPDRLYIDQTVSFARDWFARLAMAYLSFWYEERKSDWLPADWLPAVQQKAIETARAVWRDRGDWFDRVCLPEVSAALERAITWFLAHARHLKEQRIHAAVRRQRLAEERAAGRKPVPVEIEAVAAMAGVSVEPLRAHGIAPPAKKGTAAAPPIAEAASPEGDMIDYPPRMKYPPSFPPESVDRVELEHILAKRDFDKVKRGAGWTYEVRESLRTYTLREFLAFAREARDQNLWQAHEMNLYCQQFLLRITIDTGFNEPLSRGVFTTSLSASWERYLEESDLWGEYDDILLEVAKHRVETPAAQLSPASDRTTLSMTEMSSPAPALIASSPEPAEASPAPAQTETVFGTEIEDLLSADARKAERRKLRDDYIAAWKSAGVKETNTTIAQKAYPKTEFQRG
jgi:hypothetical protein